MPYAYRRSRSLVLASVLSVTALAPATASAAVWGSFSSSRIAYATGALSGDVHSMLRGYITANGDALADGTDELTPEYLSVIDVFYTAMLSDGTGPTAGSLGTLSLDEQAALADFIAGGGTLIITPDSNGFDGPFPIVYDSWTADYGVTDYAFVFGPGAGQPLVDHPITDGLNGYSLDGTTTFTYPTSGQILGGAIASENPFLVVFEPASGFDVGGRMLVVADHNALTDGLLEGDLGNQQLAQNIVMWAAGECGNSLVEGTEDCDDGNVDEGDGCDATCELEQGGSESSSGGLDDTAGTGSDSSGGSLDDSLPPESSGIDDAATTGDVTTAGSTADDAATTSPETGDDDGCGCRHTPSSSMVPGLLLLAGATRRRRR